jgi:hypothetical protein
VGVRELPLPDPHPSTGEARFRAAGYVCDASLRGAALPGVCDVLRAAVLRGEVPAVAVRLVAYVVLPALVPAECTEQRCEHAASRVQDVRVPVNPGAPEVIPAPGKHRTPAPQGAVITSARKKNSCPHILKY